MKKILLGLLVVAIGLIGIVLIRTFTFSAVDYSFDQPVKNIPAHPVLLSEAVQYKTISLIPGTPNDSAFVAFQTFLDEAFPLVDSLLTKQVVHKYSLIYKWEGSDKKLKPLILTAHQDVVPVEKSSLDEWDAPPFSGKITDKYIYGRGSFDDKGSLIAIMEAVEGLLQKGFTPKRTVYLCFGHDEEVSGKNGAQQIAAELYSKGLKAWMVVDEGGTLATGLVPGISKTVALIGTSEKGYMSVKLEVELPGGHSSMPEPRNAISVLNAAIYTLEQNPMPDRITSPMQGFVDHIGPHLPFVQKMAFANTWLFKPMIFSVYKKSASGAALIHTTQVPTIFKAGVKDNVVPTHAEAVLNYRLLPGDSPETILDHIKTTVKDSAVKITTYNGIADKSSPMSDYKSEQFRYLAEVIGSVNKDVIISPYLVLGGTDSKYYYNIADEVFRFSPIPMKKEDLSMLHGVNERISKKSYQQSVNFYATLIGNM